MERSEDNRVKLISVNVKGGGSVAFKQEDFIMLKETTDGDVIVSYFDAYKEQAVFSADDFWTTFRRCLGSGMLYQCNGCIHAEIESSPDCRICCRNWSDKYLEVNK